MALRALIEVWPGETGIYIHELPGVYAGAATRDQALDILPDVVEYHLAWLASHGFDVDGSQLEIVLAEELKAVDGRYGPLFEADREVATSEVIEHALQVASLARRDVIDVYRSVSEARRDRPPASGGWSLAQHLAHIAETEQFYLNALPWSQRGTLPGDPIRAVQASALLATSTLRDVPDDALATVYSHAGEAWTVSKVLRRMTAHLREHLPWVREIASG